MFKNDYESLDSLTFSFNMNESEKIDIRIHDKQIFLIEDMLSIILRVSTEELLLKTMENIKHGNIIINDHLRYFAWYGSSGGKLYKLIGDNITLYKKNSVPTLEDDQLKLIFSHEAIDVLMDEFNYNNKSSFFSYCDEIIRESKQYKSYLQFIIAGVNESITKIKLNSEYSTFIMSMPEHNDFLSWNWTITDVFHYNTRFKESLLSNNNVISLISNVRCGELEDITDINGQIENNYINELLFKQEIEEILHKFKLIRLVTNNPIYCTEVMTQFTYSFIGIPQYLQQPKIFKSNKLTYEFNDTDIDLINSIFNEFSFPIDDEVVNLLLTNYDYSFYVPDDVAILILVSCLEILYHPGDRDELKFRIARNAAIFLGIDEEKCTLLFDEIKKLYDIRSSLVHTGKFNLSKFKYSNKEDVIYRLRRIVSCSILKYKAEVVDHNVAKVDYFDQLNRSGFGSYPFNNYDVNLF